MLPPILPMHVPAFARGIAESLWLYSRSYFINEGGLDRERIDLNAKRRITARTVQRDTLPRSAAQCTRFHLFDSNTSNNFSTLRAHRGHIVPPFGMVTR